MRSNVEIINTRGMSQFADGGLVATKPYVSSGSYINKMSNYCKSCIYKISKKETEDACPFNSLYWNFLDEKRTQFKDNQRMTMMMQLLDKMDSSKLAALKNRRKRIELCKKKIKNQITSFLTKKAIVTIQD